MINDTEQNERSQKRLTKESKHSNNGQKTKNTFSNILKTFFFFIKKTFPIISKKSVCSDVLKRLSVLFKRLLQKISVVFSSHNPKIKLKKSAFGYVLILFIGLLPVILYGTKYILDNRTLLNRQSEGTDYMNKSSLSSENLIKQCAQEIALAVAKKWNPALSYYEQRESLLRIADEIYNNSPTYVDTLLNRAISKIDIPKESSRKGTTYEPIKITKSAENRLSPSLKQIGRTSKTTNMKRYYYWYYYDTYNAPMALNHFHIMYQSLLRRHDAFTTDDDIYLDYCYYVNGSDPITSKWYHYVTWPEVVGMSSSDGSSNVSKKDYTIRTNLNDNTVKVECKYDQIRVTTDNEVAYAVPAECNVDIILTVPTNSAALNKDNRDKNTTTAGTTYTSTSTTPTNDAKSTPIYQITREYQTFLKNFFYTRGVNIGVIPYSGNVSLYNDRSEWQKSPDKFILCYPEDIGSYEPVIIGAMMYYTVGTVNESLKTWGTYSGHRDYGFGIQCRGETIYYNKNPITIGDLLSTKNPSNYKFRRHVYNPCRAGDANLLSMKCERTGSKYWMNPYFILELNPDVKFIYGMLGAFYPYYDDKNVSNFIFIPVTWANNLLQSWSKNGENSSVDTKNDSSNLGRLSTPSKNTSGRKKALILVVNKPDWFEPEELTYLGFDNDYSEIPMAESDAIRGDINYSDTTQKFADGSSFDGTIQGPKKILKLEKQSGDDLIRSNDGFYECGSGTYRLKFPQKGTIKLVVAPATNAYPSNGSGNVIFYSDNITDSNSSDKNIKDSNGTQISLDTPQTVLGEKTFVFSGGSMHESRASSDVNNLAQNKILAATSTNGKNFGHNLCVKKVRYKLSDAKITNCVLKNQILRDYLGKYAHNLSATPKGLIFSDNSRATRNGQSSYSVRSTFSMTSDVTVYIGDNNDLNISKSRDSCIKPLSKYVYWGQSDSRPAYRVNDDNSLNVEVAGISAPVDVNFDAHKIAATCFYYTSGNYDDFYRYSTNTNTSTHAWSLSTFSNPSGLENAIRLKFTSYNSGSPLFQYYIKNSQDKILQNSDDPITINPINHPDLLANKGIYLADYEDEKWICFQGDGELHVTVQGSNASLTLNGISDTISDIINSQTTYVITRNKITGGSDGNYYIDLNMEGIRLISAEITNQKCSKIVKPISATYTNSMSSSIKTDSIDFSSGSDSGSGGYLSYSTINGSTTYTAGSGIECNGSATGRLYFPYKGTIELKVAPAGRGNIHFYNDNNISDHVGDTPVNEEKTLIFRGGSGPDEHAHYKDINSTRGPNFGHNLSPYKLKYECTGCYISAATLTNQYLRDYVGQYDRGNNTSYKRLILSDGTLASRKSNVVETAYTVMMTYESDMISEHTFANPNADIDHICTHSDHHELWNKFRDYPAVKMNNLAEININYFREEYTKSTGENCYGDNENCYRYLIYGLHAPYTIYSSGYKPNINRIKFLDGDYYYKYGQHEFPNPEGNGWSSLSIPGSEQPYSYDHDNCSYQDLSREGQVLQTYWKNGRTFSLKQRTVNPENECYKNEFSTLSSDFDKNNAIYLAKLNSNLSTAITAGHYICFFGDGDLEVTVTPLQSKIAFTNIYNEETVTSEKTYTFLANQTSGESGGQYYIEFNMSNIRLISASITCSVVEAGPKITKTVADAIDFSNGNKTSQNTLLNSSTHVLTTTISGSNDNGLYKVTSQTKAKIYSAVKGNLKLKVYYLSDGYVDLKLSNTAGVAVARYDESQGQEIEVPDDFLLQDSDGKYVLTLDLYNVYILNAVLMDWRPSYDKIPLPERSSVVDFSQNIDNKPVYNENLIIYGQDTSGSLADQGIKWDSSMNSWTSRNIYSYNEINDGKTGWNHIYYKQGRGDFYGLFDDIGEKPSKLFIWKNSDTSDNTGHYDRSPYATGLTRRILPLEKQENDWTRFDVFGSGVGARLKYLMIGATLPINAALWAGASGSTLHHYQWQSDNNGNIITYDATEAVKKVTQDACTKLKGDWGSNLRIYLIKYRKQTQYKKAFNQGNANFDYSYLNNCASGTSEPYLFENVTSQSGLNTALQKIYENIKTWAGRTEAKLVGKPEENMYEEEEEPEEIILYEGEGSEEEIPILR